MNHYSFLLFSFHVFSFLHLFLLSSLAFVKSHLTIFNTGLTGFQCRGSVTFWCGSVPLTNESGSGSRSDFFLHWLQWMKNIVFSYFFLITYPQAHYLQSKKLIISLKYCVKNLFCKHYFNLLNTFMRKGKDPNPELDPGPYLWLMDPAPDPGGPKTCGSSGSGSGSPTLLVSFFI